MKNILALWSLVVILGAPARAATCGAASAGTLEGGFGKAGCIAAGIKPVCRGRADLVEATGKSLAAAEKGVALKAQGSQSKEALSVDQAVALVDDNAATNNGYCVYKTVFEFLQERGGIGLELHTIERGDDFAIFVDDINGGEPVVFKNAGEVADYVKLELKSYLYDVQRSYEPTLKERCEELDRMPKPAGYPMPDYCVDLLKK